MKWKDWILKTAKKTAQQNCCTVFTARIRLPGVVFDDAHDLDLHRNFIDLRHTHEGSLAVFQIDFQVGRDNGVAAAGDFSDGRGLLRNDGDDLTFLHAAAGTVNTLAVHQDVAVADHLLGSEDGGSKTGAVHHGIQTGFQRNKQLVTRLPGTGFGLGIGNAQLLFARKAFPSAISDRPCPAVLYRSTVRRRVPKRRPLCGWVR